MEATAKKVRARHGLGVQILKQGKSLGNFRWNQLQICHQQQWGSSIVHNFPRLPCSIKGLRSPIEESIFLIKTQRIWGQGAVNILKRAT